MKADARLDLRFADRKPSIGGSAVSSLMRDGRGVPIAHVERQ
jgi:hypothetical protein